MDHLLIMIGWIGVFAPMALGAIGSTVGCTIAGQAACGALLDVDTGYGKYIGISALPSSQVIYGIVVTFNMNNWFLVGGKGLNFDSSMGAAGIGILTGLALMIGAIYQGMCCASAVKVSKSKPEIFGLSVVPAAIVEGFAVFAFVFALFVGANIPKGM